MLEEDMTDCDHMSLQTKHESYIIEHPELRLFLFLAVTGSLLRGG
jgi:hypothetical protein